MFSGKIEDYILFEDKEIIVCRKPAGIAVQNARIGAMDLESSLKNYLAMQDGGGRRIPYLAVIHRLDQPRPAFHMLLPDKFFPSFQL